MKKKKVITVTKTHLPPIDKYKDYINQIYKSGWITNNGPLEFRLTKRIEEYLGVKNVLLVSNGTLALQLAYKLLALKDEVITTPFSFVATTSSLVWEGLNPIFVDIDKDTLCLDYNKIEKKITSKTTAIVPVHVFGNCCEIENIEKIARKYNLKVIFDAAQAFGVNYKGKSALSYGDISIVSFHATKIFHTIEGGALIIKDDELFEKARKMINFGITSPETVEMIGINCKMNEFQAAMGLCVLDDMEKIFAERKIIYELYLTNLAGIKNIQLQEQNSYSNNNYSYFPVIFNDENTLINVKKKLEENNIFSRRYFYPSLDTLNYVSSEYMVNSNNISERILCLPLYERLSIDDINKIISIIKENI
jgi:dTDP-4-amino-4,6-dideoxygalactose transaminase